MLSTSVLFDTCRLSIVEWDAMYSAMRLEELVADFVNSKIKRL
jgi:hypothetical protein